MATYTIPTTIRRSLLGTFVIVFVTAVIELLLTYLGTYIAHQPYTDPIVPYLALFILAVVLVVALVKIYVYEAARLDLTATSVQVLRYTTLFSNTQSTVSWHDVQEVTVLGNGILKLLFGVGTLKVQSAGAQPDLILNWVPDVDNLRDFIEAHQVAAD